MQFMAAGDAIRGPSVVNGPVLPPRIDEKGKKKNPGPADTVVAATIRFPWPASRRVLRSREPAAPGWRHSATERAARV